jgi:hypothetical protein
MLEILGTNYYIDIDAAIDVCRPIYPLQEENETLLETIDAPEFDSFTGGTPTVGGEINIFKFEVVKACIERTLGEYKGEEDDGIGAFVEKSLPPSFKIAFNTLLKYKILKEEDDE